MLSKRHFLLQFDSIFLLILAVAAFLLFFSLDHRPFWQDEAETACLARNVLDYGVPKAFDGVNLISQESSREFNRDYIWRWSPWLQIYLTAGAFWLGGVNTVAGRLPFALLGFASVVIVYLLIKRLLGNLAWARLAAALMASSVLFLLFSLKRFPLFLCLQFFRSRPSRR
jgi:4-amino-4-deoxy-L-arabinose transferase-like glycosyltransferase